MPGLEYTYICRVRPVSMGTVPNDFISFAVASNPCYGNYGTVTYPRPLTSEEVEIYSLAADEKTAVLLQEGTVSVSNKVAPGTQNKGPPFSQLKDIYFLKSFCIHWVFSLDIYTH